MTRCFESILSVFEYCIQKFDDLPEAFEAALKKKIDQLVGEKQKEEEKKKEKEEHQSVADL